jgi:hypothetical protein
MPDIKVTPPEGEEVQEEVKQTEVDTSDTPEYSEVELEAMKHGWRPESEFVARPGKKWKSAEKFMEDKPLYDKIDEQHKYNKRLEKQVDAMRQHYERVETAAYERAMADLKAQRKQALEEGDLVRAEELRDEIDEKKTQKPAVVRPQGPDPEVVEYMDSWKKKNDWYNSDEDLTAFADGIGNKMLAQGKSPQEILTTIESKVRIAFPQKFRNPNRDSAPKLEGGSTKKAKGPAGDDVSFMSAKELTIMEAFLKSGAPITREEYIRDMKRIKGVK